MIHQKKRFLKCLVDNWASMALIMVSEMGFLQPQSNDFYFSLNIIKNVKSLVK